MKHTENKSNKEGKIEKLERCENGEIFKDRLCKSCRKINELIEAYNKLINKEDSK